MRKMFRAGRVAAAALAAIIAAGAFTFQPAGQAAGPPAVPAVRPGGPAILARHLPPALVMSTGNLLSLNWDGYAAIRPGARFRSIQVVFLVPYLDCATTP